MSTSGSSAWSYSDSPTTSCNSAGGGPIQWMPINDFAVQNSGPFIEIVEEPQTHTRLRYPSEGDHGYLYGVHSTEEHATYPTVRLVNYDGKAYIRCEVYQFNRKEAHPHLLQYDKGEEKTQIDFLVPCRGSYTVCYNKLSFVRKSIGRVTEEEQDKYRRSHPNASEKQIKRDIKKIIKGIDMNRVRLRFSAHDAKSDDEICHVYSNPILDKNSPDTNELKINRVSHLAGEPGDEIILLVTKINKYVKVRFVDPNAKYGVWCPFAYIKQVHRQVAIVCRVPEYKQRDLSSDVQVYIELVRESDGVTSNFVPFIYKKQRHLVLRAKKRSCQVDIAENSPHDGMGSVAKIKKESDENIKNGTQVCQVPVSLEHWSTNDEAVHPCHSPHAFSEAVQDNQRVDSNGLSSASNSDSGIAQDFQDDLFSLFQAQSIPIGISEEVHVPRNVLDGDETVLISDPVLGETSAVVPPTVAHPITNHQSHDDDFTQFYRDIDKILLEYMASEDVMDDDGPFQGRLISDSPHIKLYSFSNENTSQNKMLMKSENTSKSGKISIRAEVDKMKELVKDVIAIVKRKGSKNCLKTKLEQLYDLDLPNGNTFLHVSMNRVVTFFFANALHAMKMGHLLNRTNDLNQTVLHLAVLNKWPDVARILVSKGVDPMMADTDGNNAIHQAVMSYETLEALLDGIAAYKVAYDINATNDENQTPLHIAAINDCKSSLRLLLDRGADTRARDYSGRTALHLAACRDRLEIVRVLLDYMDPGDVDAIDLRGQTALQIACDSDIRENTLSIIQLLLDAKANPTKCDDNLVSALNLAKRHPQMLKVIQRHMASEDGSDDDEYFTGDEGEYEDEDNIVSMLHAITINGAK